ncbi:MAG: hypothetical protein PHG36_07375 [Dehalococcoidia bacterium]|nr:hypothetical protein [Dehalococcoidia bacterium]
MSKLKSKLPGASGNIQDLEAFIAGAETKSTTPGFAGKASTTYPWQEPGIRDDVLKIYNLRLPEPYLLKLKYIAEHTPDSMQKFCWQVLQDAIDKKIEELTQ